MTPAQNTQLDDANRTIAQQCAKIEQLKIELSSSLSSALTERATIEQMSADMLKLQSQVAWLSRQLFGRKSEKYALPAESSLFADLPQTTPAPGSVAGSVPGSAPGTVPAPAPAPTQTITYEREVVTPSERGKRLPIPADLPRIERVHDLPASEKAGMKKIGQEISEKIEYEPGKVYVIRDVQIKYARIDECLDGSLPNVLLATKPDEGLPKCIAGPSLLAHIAVSKFADSLPLHRLEGILRRSNVDLSRSSMCRPRKLDAGAR